MASPVRAGTLVSDSGGTVVSELSHTAVSSIIAGDYLTIECICECNNPSASTLTLHADAVTDGWVKLVGVGDSNSDVTTAVFYKKVAVSDDTGKAVVILTAATGEMLGWFARNTGAKDAAPEASGTSITTGTSHTLPDVSSTTADTLGIYVLGFDGADGDPFGAPGGSWTEQDEHQSGITANDAGGVYGTQSKGTAGAYGAPVITSSVDDGAASIVYILAAPSGDETVAVTGVAGAAAVGTVTVTGIANVPVTGLAATAAVGTAVASIPKVVQVSGLAAAGKVGTTDCSVLDSDGNAFSVTTSVLDSDGNAFSVSTNALDSDGNAFAWCTLGVTVEAKANVFPTGLAANAAVGTVTVDTGAASVTVLVTGVAAAGAVGTVTTVAAANVSVTGVAATAFVGTVGVIGIANVPVTGLAATTAVGSVTVDAQAVVAVTGLAAAGEVGTVTTVAEANVAVTGVAATGQVGAVTIDIVGAVTVAVTGLAATGAVGSVTVTAIQVPVLQLNTGGGADRSDRRELPETQAQAEDKILMQFVEEYMKKAA